MHVVLAVDALAALYFQVNGPADHVAAGQVFDGRRVPLHKPLPVRVQQHAALAAHAFGDQDAQFEDARRMELEEFHILQRYTATQTDRRAISGERMGVGSHFPTTTPAARGKKHRFAVEDVEIARGNIHGNNAAHLVAHADQVYDLVLVVEIDVVLNALLVQRLQDHVPRAVGGVAGAVDRLAGFVIGMTAKAALRNFAVGEAIKGQTHVFQFNDGIDGFLTHHVYRILVGEIIGAFYSIVGVPFPTVRLVIFVRQSSADASLGRARVGACGVELGQNGDFDRLTGVQRRHQASAARAHDDGVKMVYVRL